MDANIKKELLHDITKKLIVLTSGLLLFMTGLILYATYGGSGINGEVEQKPVFVLLVFMSGILGGFVSIQQRLPNIDEEEIQVLSSSWFSISLIPINGGIFAFVLMLMFIGGIVQGELFPNYDERTISGFGDLLNWVRTGYPNSSAGVAKLLFWSFVAGFSERFVPQVILKTANGIKKD